MRDFLLLGGGCGFGIPILVLLLVLFVIVFDRRRARPPTDQNHPLCPRCGYDLTANASGRCPECGLPTHP